MIMKRLRTKDTDSHIFDDKIAQIVYSDIGVSKISQSRVYSKKCVNYHGEYNFNFSTELCFDVIILYMKVFVD